MDSILTSSSLLLHPPSIILNMATSVYKVDSSVVSNKEKRDPPSAAMVEKEIRPFVVIGHGTVGGHNYRKI